MELKSYSELSRLNTFEERFRYLQLGGSVGADTFGFDRYVNQQFYKSSEWMDIRHRVIARDLGCDLGIEGMDIHSRILIHHMNPISVDDIRFRTKLLLDPEYLICTTHKTHNAIHYGDDSILKGMALIERTVNDTCPWKR